MQQQDPNQGDGGESRLRRIRVGGGGEDTVGGASGQGTDDAANAWAWAGSDMSAGDERTWSMLSHLSVLLSLISGVGGPVAALVIWLVYKDRSDRVAFHALQSLLYGVAWLVLIAAYTVVSLVLAIVLVGFLMLLFVPVLALIPLVHQCYAAYKVNLGVNYRYPIIADMVDRERRFG